MTSVLTKSISIFAAEQFKESVSEESNTKIYLTFGRVQSWANDSIPDQANTSVSSGYEVWKNMIGGKKLTGNDIRHVIPRYDWTSNTAYTAYDHSLVDLPNKQFYVITDQWNVYKCIANNYEGVSNTKPTYTQA